MDRMSIETALLNLVAGLEQDRSLRDPTHLRQRVEALDALDAHLADTLFDATPLHSRANAIRVEL